MRSDRANIRRVPPPVQACCPRPRFPLRHHRARERRSRVSGQARSRARQRCRSARRRASCIRRSTAATTGTRACTCIGCSSRVRRLHPACRSARRSTRCSIAIWRRQHCGRVRLPRAAARAVVRADLRLGVAAEARRRARGSRRCRRAPVVAQLAAARARLRRALSRVAARKPTIRCATGCIPTARSACCSRSTTRAARTSRALSRVRSRQGAELVRAAIAMPPRRGSRRASISCRRRSIEAELMRRVLPPTRIRAWLDRIPARDWAAGALAAVHTGRRSAIASDPHIVHLDGLNLSRAWCFRGIASALAAERSARGGGERGAPHHICRRRAGARRAPITSGAHWLASFAALALVGAIVNWTSCRRVRP